MPSPPGDQPLVSLVVLNWNGRDDTCVCLESVTAIDYPPDRLQIVLCDNGSTDGSVEAVQARFPRVEVLSLDRNYGFAEGNNRAARFASGEWVGFLNNDLRVDPGWLRAMLAEADRRPGVAAVSGKILSWDGTRLDFVGGAMNFHGVATQPGFGERSHPLDRPRRLLFACGGAMLVRRQLFVDVGGFDPDYFLYFEDVDLGWRLNILGHDIWYAADALAFHRHHGTTKRVPREATQLLYDRNSLYTIFKCFEDANLAAVLPAALLLLNERGVAMSGIDPVEYAVDGAPARGARSSSRRTPAAAWGEAVAMWRREGIGAVASRILDLGLSRALRALSAPGHVTVPRMAFSPALAASEFARHLDVLQERRRWLQERRVRSDAEIMPLFVEPFQPAYPGPDYRAFQQMVCDNLGVTALLSPTAVAVAEEATP